MSIFHCVCFFVPKVLGPGVRMMLALVMSPQVTRDVGARGNVVLGPGVRIVLVPVVSRELGRRGGGTEMFHTDRVQYQKINSTTLFFIM